MHKSDYSLYIYMYIRYYVHMYKYRTHNIHTNMHEYIHKHIYYIHIMRIYNTPEQKHTQTHTYIHTYIHTCPVQMITILNAGLPSFTIIVPYEGLLLMHTFVTKMCIFVRMVFKCFTNNFVCMTCTYTYVRIFYVCTYVRML